LLRIRIALRYLAGGSPLDIALVHGVSHCEVIKCVWMVIDAINNELKLDIKFPTDHNEQLVLANQFQQKSDAGFAHCIGAIDGMLVWIHKPSKVECAKTSTGKAKYFCGRNIYIYILSLQATCDANRKFLDIYLGHPGAASDFLCFQTSPLQNQLEQPNFLHPDHCIYGDNEYVNTPYMETPYKSVGAGPEDNYN
jgi:DDE superfamily endonuclease